MCTSFYALNRKQQKLLRLKRPSRIVGPQYGACFMSQFWRLEYGGKFESLDEFLDERSKFVLCMLILANTPKACVTVGLWPVGRHMHSSESEYWGCTTHTHGLTRTPHPPPPILSVTKHAARVLWDILTPHVGNLKAVLCHCSVSNHLGYNPLSPLKPEIRLNTFK